MKYRLFAILILLNASANSQLRNIMDIHKQRYCSEQAIYHDSTTLAFRYEVFCRGEPNTFDTDDGFRLRIQFCSANFQVGKTYDIVKDSSAITAFVTSLNNWAPLGPSWKSTGVVTVLWKGEEGITLGLNIELVMSGDNASPQKFYYLGKQKFTKGKLSHLPGTCPDVDDVLR